jgi:hypothetical protein
MTKYSAPHYTSRKRRILSRSTKILSIAAFLLLISLFAIVRPPARAAANPVFATFQYVDNAISTTLSPIQSAIASLQTQQANQATQISKLQNSTGKQFKVYDANGQELGLLISHTVPTVGVTTVYSTALHRFMFLDLEPGSIDGSFYNNVTTFYQSTDCTGTKYAFADDVNRNNTYDDLMPASPSAYYIIPDSEAPTTVSLNSEQSWYSALNKLVCIGEIRGATQVYQLQQVDLPFSIPLAAPLQFKYQ